MKEEWKDVVEYEGHYEISTFGVVRNIKMLASGNRGCKEVKPYVTNRGYHQLDLHKMCSRQRFSVHRLMAMTFLDNPHGYNEVNHIDEDKLNNRLDNLEWCSRQHNMEHSHAKTWKFVDPNGEVRELFNLARFCRKNSLHQASMCHVFHGKRKSHKGWTALSSC